MLKDVVIKAGSPDNEVELSCITQLFSAEYNQTFPERGVYNPQFWARRITTRFSSLLAYTEGKLVAHLALQADKNLSRSAQITFPAVDPNYLKDIEQLAEASWQVIYSQALRHDWSSVYSLLMSDMPHYQRVSSEIFGLLETAILPHYFDSTNKHSPTKRNAIFSQRFFNNEIPYNKTREVIYVPKKHLDICKYLYSGINLNRTFKTSGGSNFAMPTDIRACATYRYQGHDFSHVYVTPSLLSGFSSVLRYLDGNNLLLVSVRDPRCPDFCSFLEEHGLSFCGVLPCLLKNHECIVYKRINDWNLSLSDCVSDRSKTLAQYISDVIPADIDETEDSITTQLL